MTRRDTGGHSLHKHPVATCSGLCSAPDSSIISMTPKGRNKTTVITGQFLLRGGAFVEDARMQTEILKIFFIRHTHLCCQSRNILRSRPIWGSKGDLKSYSYHQYTQVGNEIKMKVSVRLCVQVASIRLEMIHLGLSDLVIMSIAKNRFKYHVDIFSFIC